MIVPEPPLAVRVFNVVVSAFMFAAGVWAVVEGDLVGIFFIVVGGLILAFYTGLLIQHYRHR